MEAMGPSSIEDHWNKSYSSQSPDQTGWYESKPEQSLELIQACNLSLDDPILDVGVGASTLFDYLLHDGFSNLLGLDISDVALSKLRSNLGEEQAAQVSLIQGDITNDEWLVGLGEIALWHDRAMLHFLIEQPARQAYISALHKLVRPGGFVILATFAKGGASKCSGLDILNYDEGMMQEFLGDEFSLIQSSHYSYSMPSGDTRAYLYALFQRVVAT